MKRWVPERDREIRFCQFMRQLELIVAHDGDAQSRALFCELSGKVRNRIAAGCYVDDVLDQVDRAYPSTPPETVLVELPDEQTPAQRPSASELRDESGSWLQRLGRRLGW